MPLRRAVLHEKGQKTNQGGCAVYQEGEKDGFEGGEGARSLGLMFCNENEVDELAATKLVCP